MLSSPHRFAITGPVDREALIALPSWELTPSLGGARRAMLPLQQPTINNENVDVLSACLIIENNGVL